MLISPNARDISWGYLSPLLNVGISIVLLPLILRIFSASDIGLWFVFTTLTSFSQLIEFGFQPTITRNVSYVYSGCSTLIEEGFVSSSDSKSDINSELLISLFLDAKKIYKRITFISFIFLVVIGSFYIHSLLRPGQEVLSTLTAWVFFSLGYVINFYYGYLNGFLAGRGDMIQANKSIVFARTVFILLGVGFTSLGLGLLGLGFASLISAIFGRTLALRYFKSDKLSAHLLMNAEPKKDFDTVSTLWHNSWRMGVVQIGGFLILRMNVLIASSLLGIDRAASYSMVVTLLTVLLSLACVASQIQIPYISSLQIKKNLQTIVPAVGETLIISIAVFVMGLLVVIFLGDNILLLIGSKVPMLPRHLLIFFGIIVLLELIHTIFATYLTTLNKIPFVFSSLISGVAVVILSSTLVEPLGLLGLILSQGIVQLLYNNWKWPQLALKHMQCTFWQVLIFGKIKILERVF